MKRSAKAQDVYKAIERLLKVRPRSVGELRQRLLRKGFDAETVDTVLKEFEAKGVLNDRAFSAWWIAQRSTLKPTGAFGLLMELKQKRVAEETVKQVLAESGVRESELELAKEALARRLPRYQKLDPLTKKRRLAGFLSRRGFSSGVISSIMRTL